MSEVEKSYMSKICVRGGVGEEIKWEGRKFTRWKENKNGGFISPVRNVCMS